MGGYRMTTSELIQKVKEVMTAYEQANKCVLAELNVNTASARFTDGENIIVSRSITLKIDEQ
jgi:hypothetical protein